MGIKSKAMFSTSVVAVSGAATYAVMMPELSGDNIGNFAYNVLSKADIEAAEKDINDLGVAFDLVEPADMYKAGAYILRESVERAYKETQKANEEEIKKYSEQYGTYKGRDPEAETDVFLPIKSRENYQNNANAPTLDISNALATYNVSLCNIPPSRIGFLTDLKIKVFDSGLYKDLYSYRSVMKEKVITKVVRDKNADGSIKRDKDGRIVMKTIKYKELWTESELDPFDDSILLSSFFEKSPYYQLEKQIWEDRPDGENGLAKAEKEWESKKGEYENKLKELTKDSSGADLKKDEELVKKRTEQLKKKYLAKEYLKYIYGQPYYGSHKEYVYKDNTTGTNDRISIFGSPVKKFFYTGDLIQKYVRNNYYDTITVSPDETREEDAFFKRLWEGHKKRKASRKKEYSKARMSRRKIGVEGKMDIDEDGNVIKKVRTSDSQKQDNFKFKDYTIINKTNIRKFHEWKERDYTNDFDFKNNATIGSISNASKAEDGGIKATYEDMKKKYPDAIKTHENLVKLLRNKKLYDKASEAYGKDSKDTDIKVLGYGDGLKFIQNDDETLSLTDWIRKRGQQNQYEYNVKTEDKDGNEKTEKVRTTFNYIDQKEVGKVTEKNRNDYAKFKEKLEKQQQDREARRQDSQGSTDDSQTDSDVVKEARKYLGNKYVSGGNSLTNGIDCSGFVKAIYKKYGVDLPRTSREQAGVGRAVSLSEAKPGDIVCYSGHVGLYIGNGKMIHASEPGVGIIETSVNYGYKKIKTIRRVKDGIFDKKINADSKKKKEGGTNSTARDVNVVREQTLNSTAGKKALVAEDIDKVLRGKLKGMGKYVLKYSVKYNQDPAFMASIMMTECGGNPTPNHKNNPMSNLYNGYGKPATYPTMEKGIEAGIKNISKNPAYKNKRDIRSFALTYVGANPSLWLTNVGKFYKDITGNNINTMSINNGSSDPSSSTEVSSQSEGGSSGLTYDPDIDGRGLSMDVGFPLTDKFDEEGRPSDKVYVPMTVEQKISLYQTAMYNSIEPTDPVVGNQKSNYDDGEYNYKKIDRTDYVYAKELEDIIWGSYRKEKKKFLFIFKYNQKKTVDGEGLDLDIENKQTQYGEVRGVDGGSGLSGGGNGNVVAAAMKHLGEGPQTFWSFMGMPGNHWCCMFVSKILDEAGVKPPQFVKSAATTMALANARKINQFRDRNYTPSPGDVIWFKFNNSGVNVGNETNHIGIVKKVEGDTIVTIEGNSGPGVAPYGTHVCENKHKKNASYIVGYQSIGGGSGSSSTETSELDGINSSDSQNMADTSTSAGNEESSSSGIRGSQYGGISHSNLSTAFSIEELLDNKGASVHSLSGYLEGEDCDKVWRYLRSRGYSETSASVIIGSIISLGNGEYKEGGNIAFKLDKGKNKEAEKKVEEVNKKITEIGSKAKAKSKTKIDLKTSEELEKLETSKDDILKSSNEHGVFNWKDYRWKNEAYGLYDFARRYGKNWDSMEAQIAFADWEMSHWSSKNFKQAPTVDYNEKNAMGLTDIKDKSTATTKSQFKKRQKNNEKINEKYSKTKKLVDEDGNLEQKKKEHLSDKVSWGGSLEEFKMFKKDQMEDAASVFVNCYIDPSGSKDTIVSDVIKNAETVYKEYYEVRERNSDGKHKDYIAFRGSNHEIAKESYLLLPDDIGKDGSSSGEDGNNIMEFKGAICSGFSDVTLSYGVATEHNVVAAHNMPLGTIVYIPELKGKLGGGTFKSSNGKTYDLGEKNSGKFVVADNGGPYFDFDIHGYSGKKNMDVSVVSWGDGPVTWSISHAYKDAQSRTFHANAWNQCFTTYGGFKTIKLTKFKDEDANSPLFERQ